ncbi:translocation/assembly module TamB domain-containing protein [Haloferula sargassicola]|uniref:Translocation and assembly module TamB C-terminal domain-containing protein n=1 Tax=Haloferula sargassicola TaxID=490096 RepID=A0ABP9USS9_9BACT
MSDAEAPETPENDQTRRRFWKKKRWGFLGFVAAALVWLNGPGWRFIATRVAQHYLPGLGLEGGFELTGSLLGGEIGIRKLDLKGDGSVTIAGLDKADIRYRLGEVVKGKVASVEVDGLFVDVDLAAPKMEKPPQEDKPPTDPVELLRSLHQRLVPMNLQLTDLSANIHRGAETVVSLASSDLRHNPGSPEFRLSLGDVQLPGGRALPAQDAQLTWAEDSLSLDQLNLLPGVGIRDLTAVYPENEDTRFSAGLVIDDSRLDLESDLKQATATLSGAPLGIPETLARFDLELPIQGKVTSLDATVTGLDDGFSNPDITAKLGTEGLVYDGWFTDTLELDAKLADHHVDAVLQGRALGSPATLKLDGDLDPSGNWQPLAAIASLEVEQAVPPLDYVRQRFDLSPDAPSPPPSSLSAKATAKFAEGKLSQSALVLDATARDDSPPLHLEATWAPDAPLGATLRIPDATVAGSFDFAEKTYTADLATQDWRPERLNPWTVPWGVELPAGMQGTLTLKGSGNLPAQTHTGELEVGSFEWQREGEGQPLKVFAEAKYDWPRSVDISSLNVQQGPQKIETRAQLADQKLQLEELSWTDGSDVLLNGRATVPVPENPADWKAILRSDEKVDVDITSTELPFAKLHPFLPENVRFPEASRGRISIQLTGSPAEPLLDATFTASDLKLDRFSDAPPVDVDLQATGREHTLKLEGNLRAPGYPPAVIDAVTNWEPEQWADDPETVKQAPLDASVKVADLNLELFKDFVPKARALEGEVNLTAEVTGTVGDPKPLATLTLEGGRFEMKDPGMPRLKDGSLRFTATPTHLELEKMSAMLSGGSLDLSGSADLAEGQLSNLNFNIDGTGLPAVRNDSMIVRINLDLGLRGDWETATLSGNIGVIDSLFHKDIEILPLGGPVRTVAEPQLARVDSAKPADVTSSIPEPFRDWRLDLTAKTVNPFLVRGNLAGGEAYLDARVGGTIGSPRPDGRATLREVTAKLPFSTLNIDKGYVVLRPDHPFDPVLDIKGHSSVRPYEIDIYVYGPVSDPQIQPTSNPPLPESEIYTLLASGTTTEGIEDTDAATARAAQLLIEEFRRGRLGNVPALKPLFKVLDKVDFQVGEQDPYSSRKYNSVAFELDDNWLLTAGISEQGNTRTKVTYLFRFR